jgi:uncharacterized membrane protein YgcG
MANNKPAPKNWNDVQVAIATASMVTTLACWNMFAGPDRASALERAQEQATVNPVTVTSAVVTATPQVGKVYFGGAEPQQVIVVLQQSQNNGGGGGGGNGGGGNVSNSGGGSAAAPVTGGGGGGGTGGS